MAITDPLDLFLNAIVTIVNADTELRALFGRSAALIVPWEQFDTGTVLPVLAYTPVSSVPKYTNATSVEVQFSAFGATRDVVNKAVVRLPAILTTAAFAARSVEACRDPDVPAVRQWPGADPMLSDAALARADHSLSFLITG